MNPRPVAPLPVVDWSVPWLAPYRAVGERIWQRLQQHGSNVATALNAELAQQAAPVPTLAAGPLCFVPQAELATGQAYEAHIARTARVPTRDNLHDLFNGLVWLSFPALKRRLNELQAAQLALEGVGPTRGAVRDGLALFDENAAWLQVPPVLEEALARRDWQAVFLVHRDAWDGARVGLIGHALMEKLCAPRKAITAQAWLVPQAIAPADTEAWLCARLMPATLRARLHVPLPVLGVPGWWADNRSPAFYEDATVFRPPPVRRPAAAPAAFRSAAIIVR